MKRRFARVRPEMVRFVTVLFFPAERGWLVKIVAREGRYVFGVYRRHMKVIRYLGTLDRTFGVPGTTRNWNTVTAIAETVGAPGGLPG